MRPSRTGSRKVEESADDDFIMRNPSKWGTSRTFVATPSREKSFAGRGISGCRFSFLVFVEGAEEPIDVFVHQVVRRGKPDFRRCAAADADLLGLPHPVFEFANLNRRDVYRGDRAAQCRVRRGP